MSRITNKQAKPNDFDCIENPTSLIKKTSNRLI